MFASVGAMMKNMERETLIYSPERERGRELARYLKTWRVKDGNKQQNDNTRKQIREVENTKQMGWGDSKN